MSNLVRITNPKSGLYGAYALNLGYSTQDSGMRDSVRLEIVRATEPDWIGTIVCMHEKHVQPVATLPERGPVTEGFNPDEWR